MATPAMQRSESCTRVYSGWLCKKQGISSAWPRLWFELHMGAPASFRLWSYEAPGASMVGEVPMDPRWPTSVRHCSDRVPNASPALEFEIEAPDRTHRLRGATADDACA